MTVPAVVNSAGRRRSPATLPGYHAGRPPRNKGQLFPADPPTVEEIVAVMRLTGEHRHGWRQLRLGSRLATAARNPKPYSELHPRRGRRNPDRVRLAFSAAQRITPRRLELDTRATSVNIAR